MLWSACRTPPAAGDTPDTWCITPPGFQPRTAGRTAWCAAGCTAAEAAPAASTEPPTTEPTTRARVVNGIDHRLSKAGSFVGERAARQEPLAASAVSGVAVNVYCG